MREDVERRRVREEEGSEGKGGQPRARGSGSVREGRERALVGMAKSAQPRPSAGLAGEVLQLGRYRTAAAQHMYRLASAQVPRTSSHQLSSDTGPCARVGMCATLNG